MNNHSRCFKKLTKGKCHIDLRERERKNGIHKDGQEKAIDQLVKDMFGLTFERMTFKKRPFKGIIFREITFRRSIYVWFEYFKSKFKRSIFVWIE